MSFDMKYIDAEKLIAEIERRNLSNRYITAEGYEEELYEIIDSLQQNQDLIIINKKDWEAQEQFRKNKDFGKPLQQEQPEVDLEKFTEKIKTFQGRYKHPEIVSIKGAMAFMARMFYQYPNLARQWYNNLPKVTMD